MVQTGLLFLAALLNSESDEAATNSLSNEVLRSLSVAADFRRTCLWEFLAMRGPEGGCLRHVKHIWTWEVDLFEGACGYVSYQQDCG